MKKIKNKKRKTWKYFSKKLFSFMKIIIFQYFIFILYFLMFSIPNYFLDGEWEKMNVYFLLFVLIFPIIQSIFNIHYIQTGSLNSRLEVWLGMIFYFFIIPIVFIFL